MEAGNMIHVGEVTALSENGKAKVKVSRNRCDGCKLGELCGVSPEDEMEIDIKKEQLVVGDKVTIEVTQNLEVRAIWFCLVIPCVLLVSMVSVLSMLFSALVGCIGGIAIVAVYFFAYYMLRGKKEKIAIIYKVKKI